MASELAGGSCVVGDRAVMALLDGSLTPSPWLVHTQRPAGALFK